MSDVLVFQGVLGRGLISCGIGWFSDGLSHIDIEIDGKLWGARDDAVGGASPAFHSRPQDYEEWAKRVQVAIPVTELQMQGARAWATSQEDKPYDQKAILGFAFETNCHRTGWYICSEAALLLAQSIDLISSELWLKPWKTTPGMAINLLSGIKGSKWAEYPG